MKSGSDLTKTVEALKLFALKVKADTVLSQTVPAHPEDQLKRSVSTFFDAIGADLGRKVSVLSESPLQHIGRPDLAITVDGALVGFVELKAPGFGTTTDELKGDNKKQLLRFMSLPNVLYCDGRDWTLYRDNERKKELDVRLGKIDELGASQLTNTQAALIRELAREFLRWEPIVPKTPKALAKLLAPITRMLRLEVELAAVKAESALFNIYGDWRRTLFPDASIGDFADSYAQTLTYGLLLAKLSGAVTLDTQHAVAAIQDHSSLLARTLEILTQAGTRQELGPGLALPERTVDAVDANAIRPDGQDPWLYFYEDFLAEYDPKMREERGVYYTPAPVVKAQLALVDDILRNRLDRPLGVADEHVTILDPATGTGTYLLRALELGIANGRQRFGPGAEKGVAERMANQLYGFEILVGPYAVAHLRLNQALHASIGAIPTNGVNVFLSNTLESPHALAQFSHSYFEKPLADEHARAREVKRNTSILVCVGNPPYERVLDSPGSERSKSIGGWVQHGDKGIPGEIPLIETFKKPTRDSGLGVHLKTAHNLYVYFWRWALWKVFEMQDGPGIISFITASSYLRGPGFAGMREELRRTFDELWIIDLGGDNSGTRKSDNVFKIEVPVAIAVGVRYGSPNRSTAAISHISRVVGTRKDKYDTLESISGIASLPWDEINHEWQGRFAPLATSSYFAWPSLENLLPLQLPGVDIHRSWPVAETKDLLRARWRALAESSVTARGALLKETRDRKVTGEYVDLPPGTTRLPRLAGKIDPQLPESRIAKYGFRSFDRQWIVRDSRLIDFARPNLWALLSERQVFLTTILAEPISNGPGVTTTAHVPDLHHFRGSLGGRVFPLYRDDGTTANVSPQLSKVLADSYGKVLSPEDLFCYVVAVLGHSSYTATFQTELENPGPRVPLTKNPTLFWQAVDLGKRVIAFQTVGDRFASSLGSSAPSLPRGRALITSPIQSSEVGFPVSVKQIEYDESNSQLKIGTGCVSSVAPEVWLYQISGMRVLRSWLGYRMKNRSGKSSSVLDKMRPNSWDLTMTHELLETIWALEGVIGLESEQARLLSIIYRDALFTQSELPAPSETERTLPNLRLNQSGLGGEF